MLSYKYAQLYKIGGREKNEDYLAVAIENNIACFIVADGLGGHAAGDIAAKTACDKIINLFKKNPKLDIKQLSNYIDIANNEILNAQKQNMLYKSMRTTIVILICDQEKAIWGHVGDSRIYYFSNQKIVYHSLDHSVPQVLVNLGEIAFEDIRTHEDRNRLTKVLGSKENVKSDVIKEPVYINAGNAFLLCTDGFWENVWEKEMEEDLSKSNTPEKWLNLMQDRLQKRVKSNHDNYSAIAVWLQ